MAKLIKILFVIIGMVAVLGTAYYVVLQTTLGPTVDGVVSNFTNTLPPELLVTAGIIAFASVISVIYSFID